MRLIAINRLTALFICNVINSDPFLNVNESDLEVM